MITPIQVIRARARTEMLYVAPLNLVAVGAIGAAIGLVGVVRSEGKPVPEKERNTLYIIWGILSTIFLTFSMRACYKSILKDEIAKANGTYVYE